MARLAILVLISAVGLALAGCAAPGTMSNTGAGAVGGGALGAATGAIIGHASGHTAGGAVIGAAAGALGGALVGNAADAREERDSAIAQAQYQQAQAQYAQAQAAALSSADVITLTHNQVSDDVIINQIQKQGCRFESTPDSLIALKQQGVSDRVVAAMQNNSVRGTVVAGPTVVGAPPAVVYAAPPPPPVGVVVVGPRRYWGPPPYYYRGPRYYRHW